MGQVGMNVMHVAANEHDGDSVAQLAAGTQTAVAAGSTITQVWLRSV